MSDKQELKRPRQGMKPAQKSTEETIPIRLTGEESALLSAYRAMDGKAQDDMLAVTRKIAREFRREPRLRLVVAGND